jgi:hypothetical protein
MEWAPEMVLTEQTPADGVMVALEERKLADGIMAARPESGHLLGSLSS